MKNKERNNGMGGHWLFLATIPFIGFLLFLSWESGKTTRILNKIESDLNQIEASLEDTTTAQK